jgi:DNA (cytosine-5)-methyltransferase 1
VVGNSPFENAGVSIDREVFTVKVKPSYSGASQVLDDIVFKNGSIQIDTNYYLDPSTLETWKYLKGAKKNNLRKSKSGFEYHYNEGPMAFPDPLDRPARTIITGEGGSTPSRFKHVVEIVEGKPRRLIPEELEKLNMFPPGHTKLEGISDVKRAFFMGNALVVGVVEKIGREINRRLD